MMMMSSTLAARYTDSQPDTPSLDILSSHSSGEPRPSSGEYCHSSSHFLSELLRTHSKALLVLIKLQLIVKRMHHTISILGGLWLGWKNRKVQVIITGVPWLIDNSLLRWRGQGSLKNLNTSSFLISPSKLAGSMSSVLSSSTCILLTAGPIGALFSLGFCAVCCCSDP